MTFAQNKRIRLTGQPVSRLTPNEDCLKLTDDYASAQAVRPVRLPYWALNSCGSGIPWEKKGILFLCHTARERDWDRYRDQVESTVRSGNV